MRYYINFLFIIILLQWLINKLFFFNFTKFCRIDEFYPFLFNSSFSKFKKKVSKKISKKEIWKQTWGGFFLSDPKITTDQSNFFTQKRIEDEKLKNHFSKKNDYKKMIIKKWSFWIIKMNKYNYLNHYNLFQIPNKKDFFQLVKKDIVHTQVSIFDTTNIFNFVGQETFSLINFFFKLKIPFYFSFRNFDIVDFLLKQKMNIYLNSRSNSLIFKEKLNKLNFFKNLFFNLQTKSLNLIFLLSKLFSKFKEFKNLKVFFNSFLNFLLKNSVYLKRKILFYLSYKNLALNTLKLKSFLLHSSIFKKKLFFLKKNNKFIFKYIILKNKSKQNYLFVLNQFLNSKYFIFSNLINILQQKNLIFFINFFKTTFYTNKIFYLKNFNINNFFFKKKKLLNWALIIKKLLKISFQKQLTSLKSLNISNLLYFSLIKNGKKLKAWKILFKFLKFFHDKYNLPGMLFLIHSILILEPKIWIKKKKIAGKIYEIPIFISSKWSKTIAVRWLILAAKKWKKSNFSESLANEVWDVAFNWGLAINYKETIQNIAKKNKAFLRWTQ